MKPTQAPFAFLTLLFMVVSSPHLGADAITDVDILNFALNLECLEGEFYSWAAYGHGLSPADRGYGPPSKGGKKANLSPDAQEYAEEIATDEITHVKFLRAALGDYAVPCPRLDIGKAFSIAADLAFGAKIRPRFSPYTTDLIFYAGAFLFEDVGVTAYHGALPLIKNKEYLSAAGGIMAVEAYHAGIVRLLLHESKDVAIFPYGVKLQTIVQKISDLRAAADGTLGTPAQDDQGVVYKGKINLVPTDNSSIVFSRTTDQVLAIVYGGAGKKKGLFFPDGLNGSIK